MRIFGRKKKTENPELTLVQLPENRKYDFFAALAKALLLFLLAYGALGGFLSAIELEYNNGLCMVVLFVLALFLSVMYETGKKWITNLAGILYFVAYLYLSISRYRLINNGFFAILNRLYVVARQYLNIVDGLEYLLNTEDIYSAVTMFALFLGMVEIILLNIILQNKCSLLKVAILTLPPYVIPFYLDYSPDLIYTLFLLIGYLTVAFLRSGNIHAKLSKQMRYILPLTVVLTALIVRTVSFIFPENVYKGIVPKNALKEASEENMAQFAQYGLMALFRQGSVGAGVSGGRLSKSAAFMPSYETVLKVRYTPYDFQTVYLKAFTGKDYQGDRWTRADDELPDDGLMSMIVDSRIKSYNEFTKGGQYGNVFDGFVSDGNISGQGRGIMEVEKLDVNDTYEYYPYYTDVKLNEKLGNVSTYTYYPAVSVANDVNGEASDAYLNVPPSCRRAVARICEEAGFSGTEAEIATQIISYFQDNYSYTLRPGFYFGNPDYITHFLLESKRGYCMHFASAATMMFRQMGIHARYVEGYAFSYLDVLETGSLVEGVEYDDYYDGYAPLGETALIEIEIPDSYAHAWVEIYVDGQGWIVVDPTPVQTSQEDTASFWEAFMAGNGNDTNTEAAESNLGAYLEGALSGISYVLPAAATLFLIGLLTAYLIRIYREKKLSGRERVRLEYGRIQSYLSRRHDGYRRLRTLHEQLDWLRNNRRLEIKDEQEDALYQVYFGENTSYDCEDLYRQLQKIRNTLRFGKHCLKGAKQI